MIRIFLFLLIFVSSQSIAGWLRLSGQLNKAVIYIEDGAHHEPRLIDNMVFPSRLFLEAGERFLDKTWMGATLETDVGTNPSDQIAMRVPSTQELAWTVRKAEIFSDHARFGRISIGQGDTASYYTSVVDLSKTGFIINADVPLLLGNMRFLDDKHNISSPTFRELFGNFDGLRRDNRVRYDTPTWRGFQFSTSVVNRHAYDAALRYAQEINQIQIAAATAYATETSSSIRTQKGVFSGSLLLPSGFSLTLATGRSNPSNRAASTMLYGKIGFSFNLCMDFLRRESRCVADFFNGKTSFAIDVDKVQDYNLKGDHLTAYGFAWVQEIPTLATEIYLGWRLHELKSNNYPPADHFRWLWGIMGGARIKF